MNNHKQLALESLIKIGTPALKDVVCVRCINNVFMKKFSNKIRPDYWYMNQERWVYHKRTIYERAVKLKLTEGEYATKNNLVKCFGKEKLKFSFERY